MENSSNLPHEKQCPLDLTLGGAMEYETKHMDSRIFNDPNIDLKKIRRTISNRLSAQRSRARMVNYTSDLEKRVKDLEELISILTPQVESNKENLNLLQLENDSLQQELNNRSNESRHREMIIEEKRAEIKVLKELEKTAQKNKHAVDSEAKQTPADFRFVQIRVANYPRINLYRKHQKTSSSAVLLYTAPDSATERSGEEIKPANEVAKTNQQEFEDVDQYINFDALNAADPSDGEIC